VLDVRRRLEQANLGPVHTVPIGALSRVRIGPISSLETYDQMMDQLRKIGFENAQMVVEQ
jgi:rare lipoprotein A